MARVALLGLLLSTWAFVGLPQTRQTPRHVLFGATVDLPPPPSEVSEGGGGEEYEIRFVDNQEREQIAQQWLALASAEERQVLEQKARVRFTQRAQNATKMDVDSGTEAAKEEVVRQVLPFRSTAYFTGKCESQLCTLAHASRGAGSASGDPNRLPKRLRKA